MFGKGLRLYKREKLRSVNAIDRLFALKVSKGAVVSDEFGEATVGLVYPIRMICGVNRRRGGDPVQFLISVPKKRLRHAVDRVTMRRRIREAYRHVRGHIEHRSDTDAPLDIAFIYIADRLVDYDRVLKAMTRLGEIFANFPHSLAEADKDAPGDSETKQNQAPVKPEQG